MLEMQGDRLKQLLSSYPHVDVELAKQLRLAKKDYLVAQGMPQVIEAVRRRLVELQAAPQKTRLRFSQIVYEDLGCYVAQLSLVCMKPEKQESSFESSCKKEGLEATVQLRCLPDIYLDYQLERESLLLYASIGCEFLLLPASVCLSFYREAAQLGIQLIPCVADGKELKMLFEAGWSSLVVSGSDQQGNPYVSADEIYEHGAVPACLVSSTVADMECYALMGYICLIAPKFELIQPFTQYARKAPCRLALKESCTAQLSHFIELLQQQGLSLHETHSYCLIEYASYVSTAKLYRRLQELKGTAILQLSLEELRELLQKFKQASTLERMAVVKLWESCACLEFEVQAQEDFEELCYLIYQVESCLPHKEYSYVLSVACCTLQDAWVLCQKAGAQSDKQAHLFKSVVLAFEHISAHVKSKLPCSVTHEIPLIVRLSSHLKHHELSSVLHTVAYSSSQLAIRGIELV